MVHLTLVACILAFQPSRSAEGKKPVILAKALIDVRRLCQTIEEPDEHAKDIVDRSEKLNGKFSCFIDIDKIEHGDDGSLTIVGTTEIDYQDRDRYRTKEERQDLANSNVTLKELKKDFEIALREAREIHEKYNQPRDNPNGWHKQAKGLDPDLKRRLRNVENDYRPKIAKAKRARDALAATISKNESQRRNVVEVIPAKLAISSKLAKKLDMDRFLKKKRVKLTVIIDEYGLASEPDEIGGRIFVSELALQASSISKTLVRKAA